LFTNHEIKSVEQSVGVMNRF